MGMSDSHADGRPDSQRDSGDARWMTFKELAQARGISRLSATTLVRRHGWRRQRDNQGHVIALVPLTWASLDEPDKADDRPHKQPDNQPDSQGYVAAFEAALAAIREAKDGEIAVLRQQIDRLTVQSDTDRARIDDLTANLVDAQAELAVAKDQVEAARARAVEELGAAMEAAQQANTRAQAAADRVEELRQAEAERRARGRWARVRAAWRGE
jgi:hypothetical protein